MRTASGFLWPPVRFPGGQQRERVDGVSLVASQAVTSRVGDVLEFVGRWWEKPEDGAGGSHVEECGDYGAFCLTHGTGETGAVAEFERLHS